MVDASGHAAWQEFDAQGRLTHRAEYAGSSCPPSNLGVESRQEWRDYGVTKPLAQGVNLALDRVTAISRKSVGRVASGDCSPEAPMDPDVPDSGIRLFGPRFRYVTEEGRMRGCGSG